MIDKGEVLAWMTEKERARWEVLGFDRDFVTVVLIRRLEGLTKSHLEHVEKVAERFSRRGRPPAGS